MFEGAPEEIARKIRSYPAKYLGRDLRYFVSAGELIGHYLGNNIALQVEDPFLRFKNRDEQGRNWEYIARVGQIGGMLFQLRLEPGFPEICRRLATRTEDLKATHAELAGASMLQQHGLQIHARPETQTKTEDFDFSIARAGALINAEVTALRKPHFSSAATLSRIKDKRKQLPSDKPALLMCFYPSDWVNQVKELGEDFSVIARRFFGGSARINFLVFAREDFLEVPSRGGLITISSFPPFRHPSPRHACPALDEALSRPPREHDAVQQQVDLVRRGIPKNSSGDFYRWVDWLIDQK